MESSTLLEQLNQLSTAFQQLAPSLGLPAKEQRLLELQDAMQQENFWQNVEQAQAISQAYTQVEQFVLFWKNLPDKLAETKELITQNTDESTETMQYLAQQVKELEAEFKRQRILVLLGKKYDAGNAVVAIHAGAGGTDAQDWASMLLRMYTRFFDKKGFKAETIEISPGGEAGIKSVLLEVKGNYAYGTIKGEAGVHRLVRLSPFNPAHTRETSFALVEVLPLLEEAGSVSLDPKDLKIEANTASGHGGQSVNTTYSAIRITHIPTGIKVSIQNERSQHQNKEMALKILTARVQALEDERQQAEKKELRGEYKSAEWGNQIRSYVLHPYKLVKDHRTGFEASDPEGVLEGELDEFIEQYLQSSISSNRV